MVQIYLYICLYICLLDMSMHAKRWRDLPAELLHRVFNAWHIFKPHVWGAFQEPFLEWKDRIRCQAVCRAWRDALASSSLPLFCVLHDEDTSWLNKAEWVCRTRPTVSSMVINCNELENLQHPDAQAALVALLSVQPREALQYLALRMASPVMHCFRTAALQFPQLAKLKLCGDRGECWPVDAALLKGLPKLQDLFIEGWGQVSISGGAAHLPHLTLLEISNSDLLEVDATLPALQELHVWGRVEVRLCGEQLQLPALTQLRLHDSLEAEVRFSAVPALQKLKLEDVESLAATEPREFSTLMHLTVLKAQWLNAEAAAAVAGWLAWAPPSLCTLCANGNHVGALLGGMPGPLDSITSVELTQANQVRHLSGLRRLQWLWLGFSSPADLGLEDLQCLVGLTSLRLLRLSRRAGSPQEVDWRQTQLLRRALPTKCQVEIS